MKPNQNIQPPSWAEQFLTWYCKPELLEDLQGDLNEYFDRNVKSKGVRKAKLIYIIDVLKFLRLYTIRKPEFLNLFIQWIMIGSYIKTSGRSIVRNPLFSTINIIGLAISMSVGLVMISVLTDIFSYDTFHKNREHIYRVISRYDYLDKKYDNDFMATTSLRAARLIEETLPVQKEVAILRRDFEGDLTFSEKTIPFMGYWSNPALFNVFSFELLKGNPATALKAPFSIVLTEKSALKLFGNEDAMGKVVVFNNDKQYTITGILKDIPAFSHMKFDMLGSLSTREITEAENKEENAWDHVWNTWVYLLLPADVDLANVKAGLDRLSAQEDPSVKYTHIELALQPLDEIMTGQDLGNQIGSVMGSSSLWIFGGLSFVVILSACFNYTNLSIARSLKRTREVGIRKVIGAQKLHVIGQFVVEAVIISLTALCIALLLFFLLKPYFLSLEPELQKIFVLDLSPQVVIYFILFAFFIGVAAGIIPALFFSQINAVQVLKNSSTMKGFKKLTLRKALIVFQYSISIIFITATVIVFKQYKHFVAFDLGFKTENILNIDLQGNKAEQVKKVLSELPEVSGISQSSMVTSIGNWYATSMKYYTNPDDSAWVAYNFVDENYLPLHEHSLLVGTNFMPKADSLSESEIIVNEQVLKRFNIANQDPVRALDEIVKVDGKDLRIIGILKDFHYGKADSHDSNKKEVILRYSNKNARVLNAKIQSTDLVTTYSKIESAWKTLDTVHPLDAKFYDDQIDEAFSGLKASMKMAGLLAALAICIASMGLLGMVVFTTETRLKEISIRKVMGATEAGLLYLLGKSFILLLVVATLIALPATYLFFDRIAFEEIANHAPITASDLFLGVSVIVLIALVMIILQTLKVARTNPAEVLKSE